MVCCCLSGAEAAEGKEVSSRSSSSRNPSASAAATAAAVAVAVRSAAAAVRAVRRSLWMLREQYQGANSKIDSSVLLALQGMQQQGLPSFGLGAHAAVGVV